MQIVDFNVPDENEPEQDGPCKAGGFYEHLIFHGLAKTVEYIGLALKLIQDGQWQPEHMFQVAQNIEAALETMKVKSIREDAFRNGDLDAEGRAAFDATHAH